MMQKSKAYYLVPISALVLFCLLLLSGTGQKQSTIGGAAGGSLHVPSIPSEIDFAGEKVPRGEYDLMERLDRELLVNTFWHSNTILMLKRTNRYFPVIEPILKKHGVPDDFKYLCMIESGLANVVSPSNAAGFWQFLESTGKKYGLEINEEIDERYHLEKATEAACRYLKDNKARLDFGCRRLQHGRERRGKTAESAGSNLLLRPSPQYRNIQVSFQNTCRQGNILRPRALWLHHSARPALSCHRKPLYFHRQRCGKLAGAGSGPGHELQAPQAVKSVDT
jgi:hypothetical protein